MNRNMLLSIAAGRRDSQHSPRARIADAVESRPNILWLTSEDHGPHMGCYGDRYATTPNVDALAARGLLYTRAWSNAPVCAPARTTLISGLYAPSTGGEHMRSMVPFPAGKQMFPQLLRAAGYYCTNNSKEDYNLVAARPGVGRIVAQRPLEAARRRGNRSSRCSIRPRATKAKFAAGRTRQFTIRPKVRVPAYHPDTPEVRQDWAQYYDVVSEADADAGQCLAELEEAGLADETIVFYFADHGSGMPRNKRWPYNLGSARSAGRLHSREVQGLATRRITRQAARSDRLVSFVDFAPTVLEPGRHRTAGVDARPCVSRAVLRRTAAVHLRFSRPHGRKDRPGAQRHRWPVSSTCAITCRTAFTASTWPTCFKRRPRASGIALHEEGKLDAAQDAFWNAKPPEELYDLSGRSRRSAQPGRFAGAPNRSWKSCAKRSETWHWQFATSDFCPRERCTRVAAVPRPTTWLARRASIRSSASLRRRKWHRASSRMPLSRSSKPSRMPTAQCGIGRRWDC